MKQVFSQPGCTSFTKEQSTYIFFRDLEEVERKYM